MSRYFAIVVVAGLSIMTGCLEQRGESGAANASQRASPPLDAGAPPRERVDLEDLVTNDRVLASFRREAHDLVWARMCLLVPQLGHRPEIEQRARVSAREFAERVGVQLASIDCSATGPNTILERYPELRGEGPAQDSRSQGYGETPFNRFERSLAIYPVVVEAVCSDAVEPLAREQAPIRMRWREPVRISVPDRPALRSAFRELLSDPSLQRALHGLEISLVDRNPNVLVRGWFEALNCPEGCGTGPLRPAPPASPYPPGACGSLAGLEKREALAREIARGRLSYLRDGVDFAGQRPRRGRSGFILVNRDQTIEGGACLVHDGHIGNPSVPAIFREVREPPIEAAAACLLAILGIDVSAADAARLPLTTAPTHNRMATWAIEALDQLYRSPPAARRPD